MEELAVLQDDRPARVLVAARRYSALTSRALTAHELYSALIPGGYKPIPKRDIDRLRRAELQKIQNSRFLPNLIQRNSAASCETTSATLFTSLERVVFGNNELAGCYWVRGVQIRYTGILEYRERGSRDIKSPVTIERLTSR